MARVVVIASYADSLINFRGELLSAIVRNNHEVVACAPDISSEQIDRFRELSVSYRQIHMDRTGINPFGDVRTMLSIRKVLREIKPDIVFCYTVKPVVYGSLVACLQRVPHIFSMITGLGYAFLGKGLRHKIAGMAVKTLYTLALRKNEKVFFQNHDDKWLFAEEGIVRNDSKTVVVDGSGVNLDRFAVAPFPAKLSFLLIARFIREKGICEYVEAARQIKQRYPFTRFLLVGWCDDAPSALSEDVIQSWHRRGVVEYLGKLADVRPAIRDASVYVLPSYREGTPRTVLEAMAMGRPVITTDTAGCRETVKDGENGFLVPVGNSHSIAEAMERFIVQQELVAQMGERSREIAEERYDVRKVNNVMLQEMNLLKSNH